MAARTQARCRPVVRMQVNVPPADNAGCTVCLVSTEPEISHLNDTTFRANRYTVDIPGSSSSSWILRFDHFGRRHPMIPISEQEEHEKRACEEA